MKITHPFARHSEFLRLRYRLDALGFSACLSPNRDRWTVGLKSYINPLSGFRVYRDLAESPRLADAIDLAILKKSTINDQKGV